MLKKILYSVVVVLFGFVVFYLSWQGAQARAVVNRSNEALETNNYEFFQKFLAYCRKDSLYEYVYDKPDPVTNFENTTDVRIYEVFAKDVLVNEETKETAPRSAMMFILSKFNPDIVLFDEIESASDDDVDESKLTKTTIYGEDNSFFTINTSTYQCDSTNVLLVVYSTDLIKEKLNNSSSITGIKIMDSKGTIAFEDLSMNVPLEEHNSVEYWDNLVANGESFNGLTTKEYRNLISFSFPEMNRAFIITGVTLAILIGLGLFIFWPKRTFMPEKDEVKDRFTFSSNEEKEKTALDRIAKDKLEREERENKYKNVRKSESNIVIESESEEDSKDALETDDMESAVEETAQEAIEDTTENNEAEEKE